MHRQGHIGDGKDQAGEHDEGNEEKAAHHHGLLLGGAQGGHEQAHRHSADEKQQSAQKQHPPAPLERHFEPEEGDDGDQRHIRQRDKDKGDGLPQDELHRPDGGDQKLLHGAQLLFPDHRQGGETDAHQHDHHADDPGHISNVADPVFIEPGLLFHHHRRSPALRQSPEAQAFLEQFQRIVIENGIGITADDEGGVGIRAVDDQLHGPGFALFQLSGEIIGEVQGKGHLPPVQEVPDLAVVVQVIVQIKKGVGGKTVDQGPALGGAGFVEDGSGDMLDVEIDGVAVHHELDHGRGNEKKAQPRVPHRLNELFDQKMVDAS